MKRLTPEERRQLQAMSARHSAEQRNAKKAVIYAGFWRRTAARLLDWFAFDLFLLDRLSGKPGRKKRRRNQ